MKKIRWYYCALLICNAIFMFIFLYAGIKSRQILSNVPQKTYMENCELDNLASNYQLLKYREELKELIISHRKLCNVLYGEGKIINKILYMSSLIFLINIVLVYLMKTNDMSMGVDRSTRHPGDGGAVL